MNELEIQKLIFNNPERFFELYEESGNDIDEALSHLNLGKLLIKERFGGQGGISEEQFKAAQFVLNATYYVEREVGEMIADTEVIANGRDREEVEEEIAEMYFGQKISHISENYADKKDPFVKTLWKVNNLRNHLAHGRWHKLEFKGEPLSGKKGQLLLTLELMRSASSEYRE